MTNVYLLWTVQQSVALNTTYSIRKLHIYNTKSGEH